MGGVVQCGVLTASAEVWQLAVRRAEVIGRLPVMPSGMRQRTLPLLSWASLVVRCTSCCAGGGPDRAWSRIRSLQVQRRPGP